MKEIRFWLLDLNVGEFEGQRCIFLWGIDGEGRRVLLLDMEFKPSFYLLLADLTHTDLILKQLGGLAAEIGLEVVLSVEAKKLLGKETRAVRVRYSDTSKAERLASGALRLKGVGPVYELDIRPAMLYLLETEATPCSWHDAKVSEVGGGQGYAVSQAYYVEGGLRRTEDISRPQLRALAFRMTCIGSKRAPDPKRDPVSVISVKTERGVRSLVSNGEDDADTLAEFVAMIRKEDPDLIVGFGSSSRDWPYLTSRASVHGLTLGISRAMTKPHPSIFGHFSVTGRLAIDLADLVEDIPEIEFKTLEALSAYLGSSPEQGFLAFDETSVSDSQVSEEGRDNIVKAIEQRAIAAYDACLKTMDFALQLSSLTKLPADHVLTAAVGFRVDSYLMCRAKAQGELIPRREERPYFPYPGGLVMNPAPGMHERVAVVDFRSMYPSIMIAFNISPETLIRGRSSTSKNVNVSPEGGHKFLKEPRGFLPSALLDLVAERRKVQELSGEVHSEPENRVLQAREKAVKVVSNAVYGYTGWLGARWYCREVAESTTAWGRSLIRRASEMAEEIGLKVIYGDTDSLFISYDEKKTSELLRKITKELSFETRVEKVYSVMIFTEAKKRYAGVTEEGVMDIVGLEAVRSDWSDVARRAQREVLSVLLSRKGKRAAQAMLDRIVSDVRSGKMSLSEFVLWKTVSKPLSDYTVRAPHVEAARLLEEKGWVVKPGDKIGYVMTKASSKTKSQVVPHQFASIEDVDKEYYVREQILPACSRVLEVVADGN